MTQVLRHWGRTEGADGAAAGVDEVKTTAGVDEVATTAGVDEVATIAEGATVVATWDAAGADGAAGAAGGADFWGAIH